MIEILFWISMFLWLVYGGIGLSGKADLPAWGGNVLLFFLFLFLGLKVFSNPLAG